MLPPSAILVWLNVRKWQYLTETAGATAVLGGVIRYGTATGWIGRFAMDLPATANFHYPVITLGTATVWLSARFDLNYPITAHTDVAVIHRGTATFTDLFRGVFGVCHRKRRDNHQEQYQRDFRNTTPETCYKTRRRLIEIEQLLSSYPV